MARINVIPVRLSDHEQSFLNELAAGGYQAPATVAYIALREYLALHGYQAPAKDDSSMTVAQAKRQ